MERIAVTATVLAAMGSGIMSGFFYAFSGTVMGALARVPGAAGIRAMQAVNIVVLSPLFYMLFFGTAVLGLVLLALAGLGAVSGFAAAGALAYLLGVIAVTVAVNVPMNDALASLAPDEPASAALWHGYLRRWTRWNHVRTVSGTAACALFLAALIQA